MQRNNKSEQEQSRASRGSKSERMTTQRMKDQKAEGSTTAEITAEGKYKCRTCGQVFDTLEAHNEHHRRMHEKQTSEQTPRKQQVIETSLPM